MKTFILACAACFLLGVAGIAYSAGQKEPTYPPYCWLQPNGSELWYTCGSEEAQLAHCVNLMETAMRTIDPYLQFLGTGIPKFTREDSEKYKIVLYSWGRIKHECWKEYEQERLQGEHLH